MESNKFELTGRVNYKDMTYTQNGLAITKLLLSKRKQQKDSVEYQSYNVTLFDKVAEKAGIAEKGDMVHIVGNLSTSKYEKDGKQIERMQLIGNEIDFIEYDETQKKYVVIEKNTDEKPW